MKRRIIITALLASTFLAGCSMTPDYQRPDVKAASAFTAGSENATQVARDWWSNFGNTDLDNLMSKAVADNSDIRASIFRVQQARASLKIAGANLLPSVDATAGTSRNRSDTAGRNANYTSNVSTGLNISYELDLFGANRAGVDAAKANLLSTRFGQDALNLVVMGDVANGYFTLLNLRERLGIADENLKNSREVLRIIQARFDAGSASALDLSQQKSAVASSEASRATLVQQISAAENALAVLVGEPPQTMAFNGNNLTGMKIPAINPGQPSSLLERRPDIKASEEDLIAANANIGAARAALFPSITLGGNIGLAAAGFSNPGTTALGLAASLAAPIFNGGRLEAGVEQATARQSELAESYRKTVLTSFQETEDALASVKSSLAREQALAVALKEARTSYDLSRQQFDAGAIDFQRLLDTQTTLLQAQDSFAQTRLERLSAAIDLYKALGGGWQGN